MISSKLLKAIGAALSAIAGVLVVSLPEHTIAWKVSAGIAGLGAAGGILSNGMRPHPEAP